MLAINQQSPAKSKAIKIAYWATTAIFIFELIYGALWDFNVLNKSFAAGILKHLGYPLYLLSILGVAKTLAAITILIPGFLRLKEWAYAGAAFIFIGALFSHLLSGDGAASFIAPIVFSFFVMSSYLLRPANKKTMKEIITSKEVKLKRLLLVHAIITFAAGTLLVIAPTAIPQTVSIQLSPNQYLLCYFLGAAEFAMAYLSYFSRGIDDNHALEIITATFIVFHAATGILEVIGLFSGLQPILIGNIILRAIIIILFYVYGFKNKEI